MNSWQRMIAGRAAYSLAALLVAGAGCVPTQVVPLRVEPVPLTIYVDGERLESGAPERIKLRSDKPHVLFFKKEGYQPAQVVLRTIERQGAPRLVPAEVDVRLAPLTPKGRDLKVEFDDE